MTSLSLGPRYRASVEAVLRWKRSDRVVPGLHEIHEVAGRRQSAKQVLNTRPQNSGIPAVTPTGVGTRFERTLERARAASSMTVGPRIAPSEVETRVQRGPKVMPLRC